MGDRYGHHARRLLDTAGPSSVDPLLAFLDLRDVAEVWIARWTSHRPVAHLLDAYGVACGADRSARGGITLPAGAAAGAGAKACRRCPWPAEAVRHALRVWRTP